MTENDIKQQDDSVYHLPTKGLPENKSKYEDDCRIDHMTPVFQSMIFLRNESQTNGQEDIAELINGAFRMVLMAHDIIDKNKAG